MIAPEMFVNCFRLNWIIARLAWVCFALTMNANAATDVTLFDFSAATNADSWQIVNDDVMGGVSTSSISLRNGVAVFRGEVSRDNNGGFASVRSSPAPQNLAGLDAFVVRARGDGRRYKFTVRTENGFDAPIYQCAFTTKRGEWNEHRLPFKDFVPTFRGRTLTNVPPLNPVGVVSVGLLISDKQEGPFKLELAWIKASARMGK
jgi:NADH dehydrogenase [ubiquinone] 1 alpha subcomplex assembly factor 1